MTTYGTYYLGPGSAAGLTDCYYGMYVFNYFADEDTMVKRYTVSSSTDITRVLDVYKRQVLAMIRHSDIPEGQKDEFEDTMVTSLNDTCKVSRFF